MNPIYGIVAAALAIQLSLVSPASARTVDRSKIRVACVGASITYGYGVEDREKNCYPAQMQNSLGAQYEVRNYGVSGCTLLKHGDSPYWKTEAYQQALAFNPNIV